MKFLKSKWMIGGVVALLAVVVAAQAFRNVNASSEVQYDVVTTVDVAEVVEAAGSLEARPFASLDWKTGGIVEEVNVEPGDKVKAGDVLLTLQPSSTSASIASAQADLVTAQKNLEDLLASDTDRAQAVIDLRDAQEAYDSALSYRKYLENEDRIPLTDSKVYMRKTPNGWKYDYRVQSYKGPATEDMLIEADNDLALKKAELEEAQRTYDRLKDGPNSDDVIAAQAKVDAAQATVNSMSIIAPFDGEVLWVEHQKGDVVIAGEFAVNLADSTQLFVEVQVDESDIANVKLGDQVQVTMDALPVGLTGEVMAINPVGEEISGLVKYTVLIGLDETEEQILLGATVDVTIQVSDAASALAVPLAAIKNDSQGEYVMVVNADGTTRRVDVVSGAIVDERVVVTGDLREGDQLSVAQDSNLDMPGPFGGN
ncbi:MAG: efflux RND transporter periplasmic adaptor subunit [Chloroflexi bacterium]|nr:efflux RND transporter periplasmic adaptor subunit [Chloroflexota bacterium]